MKTKVYIETFGCQMNVADTERAATGLRIAGYDLTSSAELADVVLFNTCSVRERAERKVFRRVNEVRARARKSKPIIGVMGCVAQLEGEAIFDNAAGVNMVVGTRATDRIASLIDRVRIGETQVSDLGERAMGESWEVSPVERHSPNVAFVPIIEGCNKFCSFCIVPYSRGREKSRTAREIVDEVKRLREMGYKEVHLIGQNVNSYRPKSEEGLEQSRGATPFCRLLRAVAKTGMERIKFTTSFPRDFHPDIVAAIEAHENLCNWVHLPVQSGSDRILRAMRRGHTAADYLRRIEIIKHAQRKIAITSDIIVGFPGETEQDFRDTMGLVGNVGYDALYIFKYSERPDTPAAKLDDDVSREQKSARFMELEALQRRQQKTIYESYLGREVNVLAEAVSSKSKADFSGHTTCHKVVNFPRQSMQLGEVAKVRITNVNKNSLYGEALAAALA